MMRNLVSPGVGSKLDSAHDLLARAVRQLDRIEQNTSPKHITARRERFILTLSQAQIARDLPYPRNVVMAILVGGDTSGRGSLNWGADNLPIWIIANDTQFYQFVNSDTFELPGSVRISYAPPALTSVWDVTIFLESGGPPE